MERKYKELYEEKIDLLKRIENIVPMKIRRINNNNNYYFTKVIFLIKEARKSPYSYQQNMALQSLSFPYKYDIRISIQHGNGPSFFSKWKLSFRLRVCNTGKYLNFTFNFEKAIKIESTIVEEDSIKQFVCVSRVVFNVCSFHYKRSKFILECYIIKKGTKSFLHIFNSIPFFLYARRIKQSDFNSTIKKRKRKRKKTTVLSSSDSNCDDVNSDDHEEEEEEEKEKDINKNDIETSSYYRDNIIQFILSPIRNNNLNLENEHDKQFTSKNHNKKKRKRLPSFSSIFRKTKKRKIF